jgi:hypothetical protein
MDKEENIEKRSVEPMEEERKEKGFLNFLFLYNQLNLSIF